MVEEYLKKYLSFRSKQPNTLRRTSSFVQKGIAKQQPTSDHARDCERYEQERDTILEALRVIDSGLKNTVKKQIIEDLGIYLPSYDYRSIDDWEPRVRHSLISELYMFDYAIKHLRDE